MDKAQKHLNLYNTAAIEQLEKYAPDPTFSGNQAKRGLYISKDGFAVNADVNGSLNIGRKINVINESARIVDRRLAARPVVINPLKLSAQITAGSGLVALILELGSLYLTNMESYELPKY